MATPRCPGQDLPVVPGFVLLAGPCVLLASLLTDLTYAFLDPGIRFR